MLCAYRTAAVSGGRELGMASRRGGRRRLRLVVVARAGASAGDNLAAVRENEKRGRWEAIVEGFRTDVLLSGVGRAKSLEERTAKKHLDISRGIVKILIDSNADKRPPIPVISCPTYFVALRPTNGLSPSG
jgi:hypothetical protein